MKIIFIGNNQESSRTVSLNSWAKVVLSLCFLALPTGAGFLIGKLVSDRNTDLQLVQAVEAMHEELQQQRDTLDSERTEARRRLAALTSKLAEMQARLVRIDALGDRLTDVASLDQGEFDFSRVPALGGPDEAILGGGLEGGEPSDLDKLFAQLERQLDDRELQLRMMESMLVDREITQQTTVTGRPITKGWMSSKYGWRTDPFHGKRAWHNGVDFAGKEGGDVVATAAGVVIWSGERQGYGKLIEIEHGDGFVTRYGHNKENLVKAGDVVKKGQLIALMGSTGRSTGPHVHFEVFKNGRPVDPATYIKKTVL
ncbi:peptidoglycan DD-metalloendopeptidase family protein [Porticoccus sp. W117]|nr:M23 family metallopeptidase [Porticoccus sp. W117]MDM3871761.1 peptidoglycan DD-metalloendopeptidase family protein [Porticoccus sp. W117]